MGHRAQKKYSWLDGPARGALGLQKGPVYSKVRDFDGRNNPIQEEPIKRDPRSG